MKQTQSATQQSNYFSLNEILHACLTRWYWFLISLTITFSVATYKIITTQPQYTRYCEVLIKSKDKTPTLDEQMANMANLGIRTTTNAYNEIYTFKSAETINEVVRLLGLRTNYEAQGLFHSTTLYGESLPVTVEFYDLDEEASAELTIDITPEGTFTLRDFFDGKEKITAEQVKGELNDGIALAETPFGKIIIRRNPTNRLYEEESIKITHTALSTATAITSGKLSFSLLDPDSEIITISINDYSIDRADNILHTLIKVYNTNWIKDKNRAADGTLQFIEERLAYISDELDEVDSNISSFKSRNLLPSTETSAYINISKNRDNINKLQKLNDDLLNLRDVQKKLQASTALNQMLHFGSTFSSATLNNQIAEYNALVIERNEKAQKGGAENPEVRKKDLELKSKREAIIASAKASVKKIETEISTLEKETRKTIEEISKNPEQTKYLASAEREQTVKEKLYLFLLQKREENQLSQAFTAYKTRVISSPTGSTTPTAPVKRSILTMALIIGLLVPASIIVIKEITNTKVRGRKDLEDIKAPIVGEIPQHLDSNKTNKDKNKKQIKVAVQDGNRNIINEAFRVLRTNIEFMTRDKEQNTIITTSFVPNSGKTFCIINLAVSLAIKGEKIMLIDGDIRRATLSHYISSPTSGLSNYLTGEFDDINKAIVTDSKYHNLKILPVGTLPPNPTELLESERFSTLIAELKKEYKYILIDCPPIEMVADTHIIEKFADRTLFLVRAGVMERNMLPEINTLYDENKLKNLSIILNGVDTGSKRYGYKYSYRYGYHNSYHYGYGQK